MMSVIGEIMKKTIMATCSGVLLSGAVSSVMAGIIYVDKNNASGIENGSVENPFNTIVEAVNNAAIGDTIKVAAGLYAEDVAISSKAVRLEGEDPAITTIQGANNVINIDGTYGDEIVEISGFTITQGSNNGIRLNSSTVKVLIHNNIILGNGDGITCDMSGSSTNIVNNTIAQNTGHGVNVNVCGKNSIVGNIIILNNKYGVYESSGSALVSYNNLWGNVNGETGYYSTNGITKIDNLSTDPQFIESSFFLSAGSFSIDRGSPLAAYKDPDGTRNDQGVYGGPGAANYWPSSAGGPVVINLSVTPPSVPVGGTISLQATGKIR